MYALAFSDVMNVKCSFMLCLFKDYRGQMHIYVFACSALIDVICIFMLLACSLVLGTICMHYVACSVVKDVKYTVIYFRMACLEDPPLSFSAAIALPTISL